MPDPYLLRLTTRLLEGLARLPNAERERHTAYLAAAQNPDGGWSGREGDSDLYYTAFALRGLAVLDRLRTDVARRTAAFLRERVQSRMSDIRKDPAKHPLRESLLNAPLLPYQLDGVAFAAVNQVIGIVDDVRFVTLRVPQLLPPQHKASHINIRQQW